MEYFMILTGDEDGCISKGDGRLYNIYVWVAYGYKDGWSGEDG
jgi:hypothetical protein